MTPSTPRGMGRSRVPSRSERGQFSRCARLAVATFPTAIGFAAGTERRLPIDVIADTDDPLIATSHVQAAIDGGAADALCAEIAGRAATDAVDIDTIEVVTETHDTVELVAGGTSLLDRTVHARCTA